MMQLWINALSAHGRFSSVDQAEVALRDLIECFKTVLPAIGAGSIELVYDPSVEARGLLQGSSCLQACIGRMKNRDGDLVRQWYRYRDRARESRREFALTTLRGGDDQVEGEATVEMEQAEHLIGFGGTPVCDAPTVGFETAQTKKTMHSISNVGALWRHLPRYEANPKHRLEPYTRAGGEEVARMTLKHSEAQECLLRSVVHQSRRFGVHRGRFVCFPMTGLGPDGAVFHGYEVSLNEVPDAVVRILEGQAAH